MNGQLQRRLQLCNGSTESLNHLMFECPNAKAVRTRVFRFIDGMLAFRSFEEEIGYMNKLNKKKTDRAKLIVACWTEMIYDIWMQRNNIIFASRTSIVSHVVHNIVFKITGRVSDTVRELLIR